MNVMPELAALEQERRSKRNPEIQAIMDEAGDEVAALDIEHKALRSGDKAPSFTLPNATGQSVSLESVLANGPAVIVFYRGGWCPYCSVALRVLQARLDDIQAQNATLLAISPEQPDYSLSTTEKLSLEFEVLSDTGNQIARRFGLVFTLPESLRPIYSRSGYDIIAHNGDASFELPVPGTFVVGTDGVIALAHVDSNYTRRLSPDAIIAALKELQSAPA